MRLELYLIRHSAVAAAGMCYGHLDVPLAESFASEAELLRAKLPLLPETLTTAPWRVFSSPATRCRQLADTLWPGAVAEDERLRELHFGEWEGRPWDELPPEELNPWMADFVALAPPGGEAFAQLHARAGDILTELLAAPEGGPVALVTHAGVVRSLLCHALGLPLAQAFQLNIDFASVSGLRYGQGRWEVRFVNR